MYNKCSKQCGPVASTFHVDSVNNYGLLLTFVEASSSSLNMFQLDLQIVNFQFVAVKSQSHRSILVPISEFGARTKNWN